MDRAGHSEADLLREAGRDELRLEALIARDFEEDYGESDLDVVLDDARAEPAT